MGYNYRNTAINDQDRRRLHELDAGKEQTDRAKWLQWKQKQVSAEPKDRKDPFLKKPR